MALVESISENLCRIPVMIRKSAWKGVTINNFGRLATQLAFPTFFVKSHLFQRRSVDCNLFFKSCLYVTHYEYVNYLISCIISSSWRRAFFPIQLFHIWYSVRHRKSLCRGKNETSWLCRSGKRIRLSRRRRLVPVKTKTIARMMISFHAS